MKKVLKIIGITLLVIIGGFIVITNIENLIVNNSSWFKDNYYEDFKSESELEKKYSGIGKYELAQVKYKSENKNIKNIRVWYPKELEKEDKTYPTIFVVNASNVASFNLDAAYKRLASWGFIVVGNDDRQSGTGESASKTLDFILNVDKDNVLYNKVDKDNIGIIGYSQGGAGALRAVTEFENNDQHLNYKQIGEILGKHRTTISREIKLGLIELETSYLPVWKYCAEVAQRKNEENETAKGTNLKIGNDMKLANFIEKEIKKEKSSPEVIEYKIKQSGFATTVCFKTIYNYIDKEILEVERKDLTCGNYKKKEKIKKEESEYLKPNKEGKTIHDRPEEIKTREEIGHWEMDLVEGLKGQKEPYLLVLSERKTRKEIIELIPNKSAESVGKALDRIERQLGVVKFRETFKTITTDNGAEFRNWKIIEKSYTGSKKARTKQYFADAYCSWQRGTNENINKMIRRFLPKGTSFKNLTQEEVKRIEKWINNYPRKILKFKTSEEYYKEEKVA